MNRRQLVEAIKRCSSTSERAQVLLEIGVGAKIDIVNLEPVYRAYVNEIGLPVTGDSKAEVIQAGIAFLQERIDCEPTA